MVRPALGMSLAGDNRDTQESEQIRQSHCKSSSLLCELWDETSPLRLCCPLPSECAAQCAVVVPGGGAPGLEGWRGKKYGHGKRLICDNREKKAYGDGEGGIHRDAERRVMAKGGSAEKRGLQLAGSVHSSGEWGECCCWGGGDVRVSHGAPRATRRYLNLCCGGRDSGPSAERHGGPGVPGLLGEHGALRGFQNCSLQVVPMGNSARWAG